MEGANTCRVSRLYAVSKSGVNNTTFGDKDEIETTVPYSNGSVVWSGGTLRSQLRGMNKVCKRIEFFFTANEIEETVASGVS